MIINIPTSTELNETALRLYFSVWSDLIGMKLDFAQTFPPGEDPRASEGGEWSEELSEYLEQCQPELHSLCAVIQQSNELALKARVCEVSPYLLLVRSDLKFSQKAKDIDFSDLKTLDAIDLVGAVNSLTTRPLSSKFVETYHQIRSLRNKVTHLGQANAFMNPEQVLDILVQQYLELWRERGWLKDRLKSASTGRRSFFHDGRHSSAHAEVMFELPHSFDVFSNSEFKQLFGRAKNVRRYLCHRCTSEAETKFSSRADFDDCKTAFLAESGETVECFMCGVSRPVMRKGCINDNCRSNVISTETDEYGNRCHSCGEEQSSD